MSTSWTDPFELRRLLIKLSRGPSGGTQEDVDVITFHFAKITGGAIDAGWVTADYTALEARIDTLWTSLKTIYPSFMSLAELRWYKDGPVWAPSSGAAGPPNPAERVTARAVPGTAAGNALPPQLAITLTEITVIKKRWGRVYLPAPNFVNSPDAQGRIHATDRTNIIGWFTTFYNGAKTDGKWPVVFSRGNPAYTTRKGTDIPSHVATAYSVDSLQIDNLFDVVRSRRYDGPTARTVQALA